MPVSSGLGEQPRSPSLQVLIQASVPVSFKKKVKEGLGDTTCCQASLEGQLPNINRN